MKKIATLLLLAFYFSITHAQVCTVNITHIINGNSVQYFGSSTDNPATWSWFFNGGSPLTSSLQNPTITYANAGTYICALTVSGGPNSCQASLSSKTDTVVIAPTGITDNTPAANEITLLNTNPPQFIIENAKAQTVTINLLDILGKKVATLFEGNLKQGSNQLGFNAPGISNGFYVLQVIKQNKTVTKKFQWGM